MKRIFGELNMSWPKVILFAVLAGVYTGAVMLVPAFKNTSFQDIGIAFEWWVIFAVIVVVNCKKSWEAMLKCFVFFLISQPLVYLVEIIFGGMSFETGWGYYYNNWLPMTFLTLPGGFIAYFCKKQNILGAIILGLGNSIQAVMALAYFELALRSFPHHLLSALVSFCSIFVMSFCIHEKKINRIIAISLPILLTALLLLLLHLTARVLI